MTNTIEKTKPATPAKRKSSSGSRKPKTPYAEADRIEKFAAKYEAKLKALFDNASKEALALIELRRKMAEEASREG